MKKSFEERLERLEELSEKIGRGDIGLDEAVRHFEEGIQLARSLEKELSKVERKVEILVNEPEEEGETPVLELFPELSELNAGREPAGESSAEGESDEGVAGTDQGDRQRGSKSTGD